MMRHHIRGVENLDPRSVLWVIAVFFLTFGTVFVACLRTGNCWTNAQSPLSAALLALVTGILAAAAEMLWIKGYRRVCAAVSAHVSEERKLPELFRTWNEAEEMEAALALCVAEDGLGDAFCVASPAAGQVSAHFDARMYSRFRRQVRREMRKRKAAPRRYWPLWARTGEDVLRWLMKKSRSKIRITDKVLETMDTGHDDCPFCLGRAAGHLGEPETSNPFPKIDHPVGPYEQYEDDHWLWNQGYALGQSEPGGLLWYEQQGMGLRD